MTPEQRAAKAVYMRKYHAQRKALDPSAQRAKQRENQARYRKRHATHAREQHLVRKYGLTIAAWENMLDGQGGRCAICRTDDFSVGKGAAVDHCHRTGAVRGILCHSCNIGIGALRDDPAILRAAVAYLTRD
jgi:hypothetical protein